MKRILLLSLLTVSVLASRAQVSHGGAPLFSQAKSDVAAVALPTLDNKVFLQQDMDMVAEASPMRTGVMQEADFSNATDGVVSVMDDGTRVWRLKVCSPGATAMALFFDTFDIPDGARLFVYDATGDFVIGGFTHQNRQPDGTFYTQAFPGDVACVEYQEPKSAAGRGKLHLSRVMHGYKDFFAEDGKGAGNCHRNAVCDTAEWGRQIRSVCKILIYTGSGAYMCSGALVNNTARVKTPYVLTAYHCQDVGRVTGFMFYFNYQATTCSGSTILTSTQTVSGADMLAKKSKTDGSDFLLLRLHEAVPDAYRPYYAGWDRQAVERPSIGKCIHHPSGDHKRISTPNSVQINSNFYKVFWRTGVVEGGSSGSPLFNQSKLIIGQLYGGTSSCSNQSGYDLYGRVGVSWLGGGTASTRLQDWLDPINSNVMSIEGLDYSEAGDSARVVTTNLLHLYPNPCDGMFRVDVEEIGEAIYHVYDLNGRLVYDGRTVFATTTQAINLTSLPYGAYSIELYIADKKYANTVVIKKK